MAKRSNGIAFQALDSFYSKKARNSGGRSSIAFSTFARGNSADAASIATISGKPSMSAMHPFITPDNQIEDPSISPIIITFPVRFTSTQASTLSINPNTSIPKGTIISCNYTATDTPEHRGPFKGLRCRSFHDGVIVSNKNFITAVAAEACRGGDATANYTCLMAGAVADTTELCMKGAKQFHPGDIVYATKYKETTDTVLGNTCYKFHTNARDSASVLKFIILHPQKGGCNAMVTLLPLHRSP